MPCMDGREDRDNEHSYKAAQILCQVCYELAAVGSFRDTVELLSLKTRRDLANWLVEHARIDKEDKGDQT